MNEEIESDFASGDSDSEAERQAPGKSALDDYISSEDEELYGKETPAEKRLRLSKQYLSSVKSSLAEELDLPRAVNRDGDADGLSPGDYSAEEIDRELIASRLQSDALEQRGQLQRNVAATLHWPIDPANVGVFRGPTRPVTTIAATSNGRVAFTGSKDGWILKYDLITGQKTVVCKGNQGRERDLARHRGAVLALAISYDNRFLASGGDDHKIRIWSVKTNELLKVFHQHRSAVMGLSFQRSSQRDNQLYSCSADRMVKIWNVNQLSYVDTLFGHQDVVTAIASLNQEHAVSTGGRDRTLRLWKVANESQLVFHGGVQTQRPSKTSQCGVTEAQVPSVYPVDPAQPLEAQKGLPLPFPKAVQKATRTMAAAEGSMDVVAMVNEEHFITGGDAGAICLWNVNKKRPVFVHYLAHGADGDHDDVPECAVNIPPTTVATTNGSEQPFTAEAALVDHSQWATPKTHFHPRVVSLYSQQSKVFPPLKHPRWITSLATLPFSNLFASGSWDGYVRIWKLDDAVRRFDLLTTVPMCGFINSLTFVEKNISEMSESAPATPSPLATPAQAIQVLLNHPARHLLLAGVSQEPKLGRWMRMPTAKNCLKIVPLPARPDGTNKANDASRRLQIFKT
ncbi:pre-rRNA processing protein [Dimargaris xerosporica]|nr:pre-rRNA processing protein [Dimargaris xerosporica]